MYTGWYENGQMEFEGKYKDGNEDGLQTWWYENGQIKTQITYKNGEKISRKNWNEDGSLKE